MERIVDITLLPAEEWKYVKVIQITKTWNKYPMEAFVVYVRPMTQANYSPHHQKQTDKQLCVNNEAHPFDDIDELILSAIKSSYPDAVLKSQFVYCDSQDSRIKSWYGQMTKESLVIYKIPDLSDDWQKYIGKTFHRYDYLLNLYVPNFMNQDYYFKNEGIFVNYDVSKESEELSIHNRFYQEVKSL